MMIFITIIASLWFLLICYIARTNRSITTMENDITERYLSMIGRVISVLGRMRYSKHLPTEVTISHGVFNVDMDEIDRLLDSLNNIVRAHRDGKPHDRNYQWEINGEVTLSLSESDFIDCLQEYMTAILDEQEKLLIKEKEALHIREQVSMDKLKALGIINLDGGMNGQTEQG